MARQLGATHIKRTPEGGGLFTMDGDVPLRGGAASVLKPVVKPAAPVPANKPAGPGPAPHNKPKPNAKPR